MPLSAMFFLLSVLLVTFFFYLESEEVNWGGFQLEERCR